MDEAGEAAPAGWGANLTIAKRGAGWMQSKQESHTLHSGALKDPKTSSTPKLYRQLQITGLYS